MALIPPFFIDCVVAIGARNQKNEVEWFGTGFLVGHFHNTNNAGEKEYVLFLVTNKHVLEGQKTVVVRFNPKDNNPARDEDLELTSKDVILVGHPDANIDVTCLFINAGSLEADGIRFGYFRLDEHVLPLKEFADKGGSEGDGIFVLGFPMGIVDPARQYVIVRSGIIARIRDVVEAQAREFLIDANIFPGNSGGPVITKPEMISIKGTKAINQALLIGMVSAYVPYRDVAVSQQTKRPRIIFEENSGLASVVPVHFIQETVELAYKELLTRIPKKTQETAIVEGPALPPEEAEPAGGPV